MLVFRNTGLDDTRHVAFGRLFGELDDVTPYNQAGRKNRLPYDELFDVSNVSPEGGVLAPDAAKRHADKVSALPCPILLHHMSKVLTCPMF